jgi:transposase-like protein
MTTNGHGHGASTQKYDWDRLRQEYVQGREDGNGLERPTLEQLAREHDIPPGTLRNRAHRDGWAEERSIFVTKLLQKTGEKTLEQLAEKASQLDVQAFSVARATFIMAAKRLNQALAGEGDALSLADQERLLKMCDLAHRMGRRALGVGDTSE